ncbi:MAG: FAD-dependent thymidylate synthase [Planctomycetia bacterium]|nr:FAD-dependent thymidylate synthase [Planctomycetia bacterium]
MTADESALNSEVRVLTEPSVYLLGTQTVQDAELSRFLADHGVSWESDSEVPAEVITETAGRLCFDEETEILTDQGWKRFAELDRTEQVMTLNPTTHQLEWQRPNAYQIYDYDGVLKCAEGRDISFAVTPEHRQFGTFTYFSPRTNLGFVRTDEIGGRRFCLVSVGRGWSGRYPEFVELPEVSVSQVVSNQFRVNYGTTSTTRPAIRITGTKRIRALARLLVYYATEGSPRDQKGSGRGIVIYGDHVEEVTSLCRELGLTWGLYTDKRNGVPRVLIHGGIQWKEFFIQNAGKGSENKRLPRWVLELPAIELLEFWNILVRTDGHTYENGREVLVTSSPTLAGQAQELLCKIGASSAVRPMSGGTNFQMYMVSRKHGRPIHLNDKVLIKDQTYKGKVYCVTTPNGVVYVRRKGIVHFSGNCYMSFAKPRPGGNSAYLHHIKEVGHGSVLEHAVWNFIFTGVSRSCTHELVRHRAGFGFSQLSQRYVDESVAEYVEPDIIAADPELHAIWLEAVKQSHAAYIKLAEALNAKLTDPAAAAAAMLPPNTDRTTRRKTARQAARSVLPNATETKIFVTANARALRHFLEQRGSSFAEPEIRKLACKLLDVLQKDSPNLFSDYQKVPLPDGTHEIKTQFTKI